MSDIGLGGRATNGGSRTTDSQPAVQPSTSSGALRTPRDVVRSREAREARRRAEDDMAKKEQAEERKRMAERAERRAAARQQEPTTNERRSDAQHGRPTGDTYSSKTPLRAPEQAYPTPSTGESMEIPKRTRASSDVKPVANQSASGLRSAPAPTSGLRQSSAPAATAPATATQNVPEPRRGNTSSFPHAFERWEALSSHWEGLTSYWIRKLELNQEQIAKTVPSSSAMSRQITDLSAAGANLFHAVVELQRLRASSERKFQRWFFETRADQERAQETQAELERALRSERSAREEARSERARAEQASRTADNMVKEMRRELAISKEEARRAWEELGRFEQQELDRQARLRQGQSASVSGVEVIALHNRVIGNQQGSTSQVPAALNMGSAPPSDAYAEQAYYEEGPSPTNTDPFTESDRQGIPPQREPDLPPLPPGAYPPYQAGSTPATSGSVQTAIPTGSTARPAVRGQALDPHPQVPYVASPPPSEPAPFYQQPPRSANLYSPRATPPPDQTGTPAAASRAARDLRSEPSYVSSISDTEYEIGSDGQLRRDDQGRPLVYHRSRDRRPSASAPSELSEDYDVEADIARERELAARYVSRGAQGTSAQAAAGYTAAVPAAGGSQASQSGAGYSYGTGPDYEGVEYGVPTSGATTAPATQTEGGADWEQLRTAVHHPTRLSDVIEEEEDRRSRASHGSRH